MVLYVLVKEKDNEASFQVGSYGGQNRTVRAYMSKKVALNNAKRLGATVMQLHVEDGVVVNE